MEIFLEAGQNYAFLLELIVHYLKLNERKKVNLVYLSPVTQHLRREHFSQSKIKI